MTIARKTMYIRQELQDAYGITIGTPDSRRHAAVISEVLQRHRHAFSHFITLQPRRFDLLDHVATVVRDEFSASLPGMTTGRNARFYISVSIHHSGFTELYLRREMSTLTARLSIVTPSSGIILLIRFHFLRHGTFMRWLGRFRLIFLNRHFGKTSPAAPRCMM